MNRAGLRSDIPRSLLDVLIAARQPSCTLADHVVVGHEDVVEEDLAEAGVTAELCDRPHRHAVGASGRT